MKELQRMIKDVDEFNYKTMRYVTLNSVHSLEYDHKQNIKEVSRKKIVHKPCKCKRECNPKRCGCLRNNRKCTHSCGCAGKCIGGGYN